jgi:hypothetical protein
MKKFVFVISSLMTFAAWSQQTVITIGKQNNVEDPPFTVKGIVFSSATGESLPAATIYIPRQETGTTSDLEGNYSLELYQGTYTIEISSIGYKKETKIINVIGSGDFNIGLDESVTELSTIVVQAEDADQNIKSTDIGKNTLSIEAINSLPPLAGEVDVIKSLTLLPGVSTVGEASSGFNVRGGGSDQNLILLGGATLYNPSHLFGFFSSFNADVIRDVSLYKGGIPANYGGRGSSIVDISYKKGNLRNWEGSANIGNVSSKVTYGGPIIKDKMSVLIGARGSYANWLLRTTRDPEIRNSEAAFYDGNLIWNYAPNKDNEFEYSFYVSHDDFQFASDTSNSWENMNHVLKWTSSLNERLILEISGIQNRYNASINGNSEFEPFELETNILDNNLNAGLVFEMNGQNTIKAGFQTKHITVNPGTFTPGEASSQDFVEIEDERALESGIYLHHDIDINPKLGLSYGMRYSDFRVLGSQTIREYEQRAPRREENIINTTIYEDGEVIETYGGFEPRLAIKYQFNESTSIKGGVNRMYQYIHLISNTNAIAPTDVWKLTDPTIDPQIVTQYSVGVFKNWLNNIIETSVEAYYKDQDNVVEYKDGADLFLNELLETELLGGQGRAYGIEFYLNKKKGRLNGWFSYTYSRSLRKVIGAFEEETLNAGDWFPSNFDKPHNATGVVKYRVGRLSTLSAIFTYSTGMPITFPQAKFGYNGEVLGYFNNRNQDRAPDYHRLDLSFQFKLDTMAKWLQGDWTLAVYNVYGRSNAFSVFFRDGADGGPQAYQLTVVGAPFPSLTYSFKF